jgi:hypothetical protein
LEVASGSAITRLNSIETVTGSNITRLSSLEAKTGSYATTGSNTFDGGQYLSSSFNPTGFSTTASLYTDGGLRVTRDAYISGTLYLNNVTVFGTQSVAYISSSQLNIGTNLITVNTDTPSIRFGGLAVYDSGSTGLTGSLLWDSQNNHWVYSNPSGSTYSGGMFISGPRASSLGSETGTTSCALMMGQGGDHITSSAIFHYENATCFYGNSFISSSGAACFANSVTATSYIANSLLNSSLISANTTFIDNASGTARFLSYGPNSTTRGGFTFFQASSTNACQQTVLTIDNLGAATFSSSLVATSFTKPAITIGSGPSTPTYEDIVVYGNYGVFSKIQGGNTYGWNADTYLRLTTSGGSLTLGPTGVATFGTTASTTYGTLNIIQQSVSAPSFVRGIELVHPNGTGATGGYIGISMTGQKQGTIQVGDDDAVGNLLLQSQGGNVGINTTNPLARFVVQGDATFCNTLDNGQIRIQGSTSCAKKLFLGIDTNCSTAFGYIQATETGVSVRSLILQPSGGNVGIGTISPSAKLSVVQDITTTAEFGSFGQFTVQGATNSNKLLSFGFNTATDVGFIQAMVNGTSYNNLLLNLRGGNVGIGTTCLTQRFTIAGSYVRMESRSTDNTNAGVYYTVYNGASVVGQSTQAVTNTGDYLISTGTSSETERFRITGTGNTCIFCQLSIGPVLTVGNQGGTDTTIVGGGSGVGSLLRMNYAGGTMQNLFQGNGDNYVNCFTGKLNAAGGVKFGNGATTLNYYEQGTWTPRVTNGSFTTNAGTENAAWYVRVGNIVTVGGTLNWSGGSGAQDGNSLRIACLPFAANNTANYRSVGQFGAPATDSIGFKNECSQMVLVVDPGASFIYIIQAYQSGTYLTYRHDPLVANAGTIYGFQATYITG